jgi:PAS domain S-box-containing protein
MTNSAPDTTLPLSLTKFSDALAKISRADTHSSALTAASHALTSLGLTDYVAFFLFEGNDTGLTDETSLPVNRQGELIYPTRNQPAGAWVKAETMIQFSTLLGSPVRIMSPLSGKREDRGMAIGWRKTKQTSDEASAYSSLLLALSDTLERLSLEGEVEANLSQTLLLQKTSQAISGSLHFDDILETLIVEAEKFFRVDGVSIFLPQENSRILKIARSHGLSSDYVQSLEIDLDAPQVKKMVKRHSPASIVDVSAGALSLQPELMANEGIKSILFAPIEVNHELIGALTLYSKTVRSFTPAEEGFSGSLASQAASAITNAKLHESLELAASDIEKTRNHMEDGLLVFDHSDQLTYFNHTAKTLFHLSNDNLGKPILVSQLALAGKMTLDIQRARAAVQKARTGESSRITIEKIDDNDHRYFEALFTDYTTDASGKHGLMVSIRDMTAIYLEKEKLAAIKSNILDGLMILDASGNIEDCNDEWRRLFRLGPDIVGRRFFRQLALRDDLRFDRDPTELIESVFSGKHHTTYAHTSDNQHIQLSVGPMMNGGRAIGVIATARDITPLVEKTVEANEMAAKAQRHLRELSGLAELSSIVGFNVQNIYRKYLTKISTITHSDEVSIYLYDPSRKELICQESTHTKTPESLNLEADNVVSHAFVGRHGFASDVPDQRNYFHLAMPVVHHSKTLGVILIERKSQTYSDHDAKLLRLVATRLAVLVENATLYHDVNARRERWEAVFRFTDEGIVIFDRRGSVVGFNPAAAEITGHEISDAISRPFERVVKAITGEGGGVGPTPLVRVLTDGLTIAKTEQLLETRMGNRIWTEISYSPIFDDAGQITSGIALIRNVQRDREVEAIKSDFISIVSHELRTPLTAIKGFLSMILKQDFGALSDKQSHYLSRVYQSNQRMIDLVEDLLDVSYIESGKISLTISPVAIEAVISEVVAELGAKGAASQIMIKLKRRQRLPLVLADDTRLHQILLNLVDNAIKYSAPGTLVEIDCQVVSDELVTTISDHGVGITKSQIERLFTKFGRIYNPMSVQAGGTGLGLYIVKNLVENQGGRIWVTSQEGKGSKFKFSLPIAKQLPLLK